LVIYQDNTAGATKLLREHLKGHTNGDNLEVHDVDTREEASWYENVESPWFHTFDEDDAPQGA
jgi:hypothetical protein